MERKIFDIKDHMSTSISCLEKEFKSPIVTNSSKVINGNHVDFDPSKNVVSSISTKVYEDGVITFIDPTSKFLSISTDSGKTWIKNPLGFEVHDVSRVSKESFIFFKDNVGANTTEMWYTYNMFLNIISKGIIDNAFNTKYPICSTIEHAYLTIGQALYKIFDADTERMYIAQIDGGSNLFDCGVCETYDGETYYFKHLQRDGISYIDVYQIVDTFVNGNNQFEKNLLFSKLQDIVFNSYTTFTQITNFEVTKIEGLPVFIFTVEQEYPYMSHLFYGNDTYGWKYESFSSDCKKVITKTIHDTIFIFSNLYNYGYFTMNINCLKYNINTKQFETHLPVNYLMNIPGLRFTDPVKDLNFENPIVNSLKYLSYANGTFYVSNDEQTFAVSASLQNGFKFLDMYTGPGDIGYGRPIDVCINRYGVSLITIDDCTAVSINPVEGFSKFPTRFNEPSRLAFPLPYPNGIIDTHSYKKYYDKSEAIVNGTSYILQNTAISSKNRFVYVKRIFKILSDDGKIGIDSQIFHIDQTNGMMAGPLSIQFNDTVIFAACEYNGDIIYFKLNDNSNTKYFDSVKESDLQSYGGIEVCSVKYGKLFDIDNCEFSPSSSFDENYNLIENNMITKLSYTGIGFYDYEEIVVYFNNRNPIKINKDLNGYETITVPGYDGYIITGYECLYNENTMYDFKYANTEQNRITKNYIISLGKRKPYKYEEYNDSYESTLTTSNILLKGNMLDRMSVIESDSSISGVRYDRFRELVYVTHLDKIVIYDRFMNYIKEYNVSIGNAPMPIIKIAEEASIKIDHKRLERCIISSGFIQKYSYYKSILIETIIINDFNGDEYDTVVKFTMNGEGSDIIFYENIIFDLKNNNVYPRYNFGHNDIQSFLYSSNGIISGEYYHSLNYRFFQGEDFYGYLNINRIAIGISSKSKSASMTHTLLNYGTVLTQYAQVSVSGDYIATYAKYNGLLNIFKRLNDDSIQHIVRNAYIGVNNGFTSFVVIDNFAYIPISWDVENKIAKINLNINYGEVSFINITNIMFTSIMSYDLKFYNNKLYGSFICNNGPYVVKFLGIIEDITTTPTINIIESTISSLTIGIDTRYHFDIVDDIFIINDGNIINLKISMDEIFGNLKYIYTDKSSDSVIRYKKLDHSTPISISNKSLDDSINRNFDIKKSKSFTYDVFAQFMSESGILRDFSTDKLYDISKFMKDHIMISDTFTGRKRIDIGVSRDYNPISYMVTDQYSIEIDRTIFNRMSAFLKQFDTTTANSIFTYFYSENRK